MNPGQALALTPGQTPGNLPCTSSLAALLLKEKGTGIEVIKLNFDCTGKMGCMLSFDDFLLLHCGKENWLRAGWSGNIVICNASSQSGNFLS